MASLSVYVLTFNCALELIDTASFASQLFNGLETPKLPDLLVISLQEVAPLYCAFIGGSFLVPYFARIQDAVNIATKELVGSEGGRYTSMVASHVGTTAIMVFARDPTAIKDIETAGVGVGEGGMGNKGAVGVRIQYQDVDSNSEASTSLTFVAAHLASMEWKLERRNEDWRSIVRGLVFSSTSQERQGNATSLSAGGLNADEQPLLNISPQAAGIYKPTSHLFVSGDLNYRTSSRRPGRLDHVDSFPQPHHTETDSQHHSTLFENDQLTQELGAGRTLHGLVEAPITFPPTYKYTTSGEEPYLVPDEEVTKWSWAEHRWPSWTDRILYLPTPSWLTRTTPSAEIVAHKYVALPLFPTSDHRAVALTFTVPLVPIPSPTEDDADSDDPRVNPPFTVNPDWRRERQRARRMELLVGFSTYFTMSWEGRFMVVATAAGIVGGYFVLKALLDF